MPGYVRNRGRRGREEGGCVAYVALPRDASAAKKSGFSCYNDERPYVLQTCAVLQ